MHTCVSPHAVLVFYVISSNLLSLAQLAIGLILQMRKLDFKRLTNLVTMTQLLHGGVGTPTWDYWPPKPSLDIM